MAIDVSCELATTPVLLIFYKRPGLFDDLNLERSRHDNARAAQTLFVSLFPPKCDCELAVLRFHLVYGPRATTAGRYWPFAGYSAYSPSVAGYSPSVGG